MVATQLCCYGWILVCESKNTNVHVKHTISNYKCTKYQSHRRFRFLNSNGLIEKVEKNKALIHSSWIWHYKYYNEFRSHKKNQNSIKPKTYSTAAARYKIRGCPRVVKDQRGRPRVGLGVKHAYKAQHSSNCDITHCSLRKFLNDSGVRTRTNTLSLIFQRIQERLH